MQRMRVPQAITRWQKQDARKSTPACCGSSRKLREKPSPQYTVCMAQESFRLPPLPWTGAD